MEKRRFQRVSVMGLQADLSDGVGFFSGEIIDISRIGMHLTDLPKNLNEEAQRMTVVISGKGNNFKMLVRPCWATQDGIRKSVGFEIINIPYEWTEFVMGVEPMVERDVWEGVFS